MELEAGAHAGAEWGEKSKDRPARRNGYREQDREARAGTVELRILGLRSGSYWTSLDGNPLRIIRGTRSRSGSRTVFRSFPYRRCRMPTRRC